MKKTKFSANLGFDAKLWLAADKLRNNMDAAEYKHVVLGTIFLKSISDILATLRDTPAQAAEWRAEPERNLQLIANQGSITHEDFHHP